MGIGGHLLGPRKLRAARALTGLELDKAWRRGRAAEGIVSTDEGHEHHAFDPVTGEHELLADPTHWSSCSERTS